MIHILEKNIVLLNKLAYKKWNKQLHTLLKNVIQYFTWCRTSLCIFSLNLEGTVLVNQVTSCSINCQELAALKLHEIQSQRDPGIPSSVGWAVIKFETDKYWFSQIQCNSFHKHASFMRKQLFCTPNLKKVEILKGEDSSLKI